MATKAIVEQLLLSQASKLKEVLDTAGQFDEEELHNSITAHSERLHKVVVKARAAKLKPPVDVFWLSSSDDDVPLYEIRRRRIAATTAAAAASATHPPAASTTSTATPRQRIKNFFVDSNKPLPSTPSKESRRMLAFDHLEAAPVPASVTQNPSPAAKPSPKSSQPQG